MRRALIAVSLVVGLLASVVICLGEERVRIATYNIKYLKSDIGSGRLAHLKKVVEEVDADVIGLQEIDDRTALERVFDPNNWHIIIDDDSGDDQDLALVVRKRLKLPGFEGRSLNAEPRDFLCADAPSTYFPDKRDVLCVQVKLPNEPATFWVLVHHAKSRSGGRASTDERRAGAAREMVKRLERDFDERDFVLVGDMNDTPDDRSMNILETGNPNAPAAKEDDEDAFLINLAEPLWAAGHVSHGRTRGNLIKPEKTRINTLDPEARERNYEHRNDNGNTGDILFDQILIPTRMKPKYVVKSAKVYDGAAGVLDDGDGPASDHLPVYADFVFGTSADTGDKGAVGRVRIAALLPDPVGPDAGNETVTIANDTDKEVDLAGWRLEDRAANRHPIGGKIAPHARKVLTLEGSKMPLNNGGDEVVLMDADSAERDRVTYGRSQVKEGKEITFE